MTKSRPMVLAVVLGIGLAAAAAQAEKPGTQEEPQEKTMSFGLQALQERFEAAAPDVGEQIPDLSVYTGSGEKVRFRDLVRDHYSVVVFGCLT